MNKLKEGQQAPDFTAKNQEGKTYSLSEFRGKKIVLFFYPKDNTPGCTAEACNLNENFDSWTDKGYVILGVSPDSVASHKKFSDKFGFHFNILSDPEKEILDKYGVWGEKKMYGKTYMGVIRTTFIISENGTIIKIFEKVKTKEHTQQIVDTLNL